MRLCTLALAGLLATTLSAAAQTPAPTTVSVAREVLFTGSPTSTPNAPQTPPEVVVARLMSFDRNHDGRVTVEELSERMQGLVARGDLGGDGALDATEIRSLAVAPTPVQVRGFNPIIGSGGYGFGDEIGFSSKMHIEGAIDDLRLASDRRERAIAIGTAFADRRKQESLSELLVTMRPLLSEEELRAFTLIAEQSPQVGFAIVRAGSDEKGAFQLPMVLAQMKRFQPNANQTPEANDAIKKFKDRQQLSEPDRAQLLSELKDILTAEERDDLNAALARRPVVKNTTGLKLDTLRTQIKVVATGANGILIR